MKTFFDPGHGRGDDDAKLSRLKDMDFWDRRGRLMMQFTLVSAVWAIVSLLLGSLPLLRIYAALFGSSLSCLGVCLLMWYLAFRRAL